MAVAEPPWPRCASYHSPNTNNCQDLGNSILLLLGLIICMNICINMVTLLWRRLRCFLHQLFCSIISAREASKSSSPRKKTQQCSPAVHLRCTMDPVKMTVTPRPARRQRRRGRSARRAHHPAWDTDEEERLPHQHAAICSHNWHHPSDWDDCQSTQGYWDPCAQNTAGMHTPGIRFQQDVEGSPLKREMRSEMSLEAYVYPVNPPPPSPQRHRNKGGRAGHEEGEEQCSTDPSAPPPIRGPANVPDIPSKHHSRHLVYDALDVRRRLRELTREVEALAHCYPAAEGGNKDWSYRPLIDWRLEGE
ncbi:unnamed protein product [Pipistrellus nathusii]|uniref:Spermatid maturation protein 1 N-terminal domain-containing protein n=1 Tax=Pipistrellus nathusii TaxID=59473 RepID=A0ABN9ZLE8_PIPNA